MLRHRLVRQGAVNTSSGSESSNMPSPEPIRRRRNSQDSKMFRHLSSDSLDNLLASPPSLSNQEMKRGRRHSVACGVLYVDTQKPSLKAAFNTAVRRMSDACSMLSSAPSSTYNLSAQCHGQPPKKKENEVILPHVLGTFRPNLAVPPKNSRITDANFLRSNFQNRRFSTDCPPPSYSAATSSWKQVGPKQKLLVRQHEVVASKSSLVAVEDDDYGNLKE